MKIGLYPGSFNPWHEGHTDILGKALGVFDKVIVAIGYNPEKDMPFQIDKRAVQIQDSIPYSHRFVEIRHFDGLLVNCVDGFGADAIIRGLRNGHDLQYEMNQQYWNEDLGLTIPVVYFICDRKLSHISSSVIRMLKKFDGKKETEEKKKSSV